MLAARGVAKPKVITSSGFGSLVPGKSDLELVPWHEMPKELLAYHEAMVVKSINYVCDCYYYQPVRYLSDLYQCDFSLMSCLPELDEYQLDPDRTIYHSSRPVAAAFPEPQWPEERQGKGFCLPLRHTWHNHRCA